MKNENVFNFRWEEIIMSEGLINKVFNSMCLGSEDERKKILNQGVVFQNRCKLGNGNLFTPYAAAGVEEGNLDA